jgi:two-component system, OmpR family, KDP operon response regulator KdpE
LTRVLVVDDEAQIRRALRTALEAHGYEVITAGNSEGGLQEVAEQQPDIVLLDIRLPDLEGTEVLRRLRGWTDVPVIMLSVRDAQADKVAALDAGADDYVTKPFGIPELLARIRSALRRAAPGPADPPILRFGPLLMDMPRRLVTLDGERVHLTPTEYALLELLATNPGKLLTHGFLLQRVWGGAYGAQPHYVREYVRQLRRKLRDDAAAPRFIATEQGVGYRWLPEPDEEGL